MNDVISIWVEEDDVDGRNAKIKKDILNGFVSHPHSRLHLHTLLYLRQFLHLRQVLIATQRKEIITAYAPSVNLVRHRSCDNLCVYLWYGVLHMQCNNLYVPVLNCIDFHL
jgi:hypothetical protein